MTFYFSFFDVSKTYSLSVILMSQDENVLYKMATSF